MGIARGTNIVRDGLIFGYDTGYGVASGNESTRFSKGQPTTNTVNANHSWYGDGGGTSAVEITDEALKYKGYTTYLYTPGGSNNAYLQSDDFNSSASTVWTWSCYVKRQDGLPITSMGTYIYHPSSSGNSNGTITDCGDGWVRIHRTVTGSNNQISLTGFYSMVADKYYLSGPMLSKTAQLTPYLKEAASISDTGSLIDLKHTYILNASNVSWASDNQPDFDGTNDNVSGFAFNIMTMTNATQEAWVKMDSLPTTGNSYSIFGGTSAGHGYMELRNNAGNTAMAHWTSSNGWRYSNTNVQANKWEHLVWKWEGLKLTWYLNGVVDGTYTFSTFSPYGCGFNLIGGAFTNRHLNGQLPVAKLYNRALTADEIKQNYNAYKNRFN